MDASKNLAFPRKTTATSVNNNFTQMSRIFARIPFSRDIVPTLPQPLRIVPTPSKSTGDRGHACNGRRQQNARSKRPRFTMAV
eukprot:5215335-Lingulodinium_polyedra.AAC.1